MNLYRERGVNPASGCIPLLIQMPFLIGMFDLLKSSFALRGAPFIPGWIDDLTAPDVLVQMENPDLLYRNRIPFAADPSRRCDVCPAKADGDRA